MSGHAEQLLTMAIDCKLTSYQWSWADDQQPTELLDPTVVVHLDTWRSDCPSFAFRAVLEVPGGGLPLMLMCSAKRQQRGNGQASLDYVADAGEVKAAREAVRSAGKRLGFKPIFVYMDTASQTGMEAVLARLASEGEADILVLAGEGLGSFLPIFAARRSLVTRLPPASA